MPVHALFVDPKGPYASLPQVDCWDETRDARQFDGAGPCVLHPPCGRWCSMARLNERRWGAQVGDDGGCFEAALGTLVTNGGVLEHPARSLAWDEFRLLKPRVAGWQYDEDTGLWTCEVWQSAYGHKAHKRTWLLYCGDYPPFELDWRRDTSLATHQVGGGIHTGNRSKPRLSGNETHLSPVKFAQEMVALARWSRQGKDTRIM